MKSPLLQKKRDRQNHDCYLRIYNIDTDDYNFADMVIDTGNLTPDEITDLIVKRAETVV